MNQPSTAVARIADRIDTEAAKDMTLRTLGSGGAFVPETVAQMMELAKMMATAGVGVRQHCRGNPGLCLSIAMQAARWEMDAFAVANKSFAVNDQISYESQLIAAVVNTRAPIKGRLKTRFTGEGPNRRCIVSGTFRGEDEPTEVESPPISQINPKNSPLWKSDPDQQLSYYTKRLWARRECPEVLLGVYDVEELAEHQFRGPERAVDITPPRPQRNDFLPRPQVAEDAAAAETGELWTLVNEDGEVVGEYDTQGKWEGGLRGLIENQEATKEAARRILDNNEAFDPETIADLRREYAAPTLADDAASDEPAAKTFPLFDEQGREKTVFDNPAGFLAALEGMAKGSKRRSDLLKTNGPTMLDIYQLDNPDFEKRLEALHQQQQGV